jgi:hypothetical protein
MPLKGPLDLSIRPMGEPVFHRSSFEKPILGLFVRLRGPLLTPERIGKDGGRRVAI